MIYNEKLNPPIRAFGGFANNDFFAIMFTWETRFIFTIGEQVNLIGVVFIPMKSKYRLKNQLKVCAATRIHLLSPFHNSTKLAEYLNKSLTLCSKVNQGIFLCGLI